MAAGILDALGCSPHKQTREVWVFIVPTGLESTCLQWWYLFLSHLYLAAHPRPLLASPLTSSDVSTTTWIPLTLRVWTTHAWPHLLFCAISLQLPTGLHRIMEFQGWKGSRNSATPISYRYFSTKSFGRDYVNVFTTFAWKGSRPIT
jgi:hypothetical protein